MSVTLSNPVDINNVKKHYKEAGCCSKSSNYNPCSMVYVENGPLSGLTCTEAKSIHCSSVGKGMFIEWDGCETCYGLQTGKCSMIPNGILFKQFIFY